MPIFQSHRLNTNAPKMFLWTKNVFCKNFKKNSFGGWPKDLYLHNGIYMKKKTSLGDLFNAHLGDNFAVGDKLRDIVTACDALAKYADNKVARDGFATIYAEHYSADMKKIAKKAEDAVALLVANARKEAN